MRTFNPGSIVAVRRGGLGDLLIAGPSLRLLRSVFPEARLTLVSHSAYGRLFLEAGVVDEVEDIGNFAWAGLSGPGPAVPAVLSEAALVAGWFHSNSAEGFIEGTAALRPERPVLAVRADPLSGPAISRQFFEKTSSFCGETGRPLASFEVCARLAPPPAPLSGPAASMSQPYAVVHPGSGGPAKLWPGERFREVVRALAGNGYSGAVVLGEAESAIRGEWAAFAFPPGWILLDRPSLFPLAALISGAAAYFGNDSGVTHLAAALGTPGLAVFRSEFINAWRPYGTIETLEAPDVRDISVDSVLSWFPSVRIPGPFYGITRER